MATKVDGRVVREGVHAGYAPTAMQVRDANESELDVLARLWCEAWHDGHAQIVPKTLVRFQTVDSCHERMRAILADVRVVGPLGAPVGFYLTKDDELSQLFVAAAARGSSAAASLVPHA